MLETSSIPAPTSETSVAPLEQLSEARINDQLDQLAEALDGSAVEDQLGYELPANFLLSVVIPVYNEEKTVEALVDRVRSLPLPLEIIIVDDHSTDGTRDCLKRLENLPEVQVVYKPMNEGKGAALRMGFSRATGTVVVVQDADLEYDPRDIPSLLGPLVQGEADVVYGSRFLSPGAKGSSWIHQFGNRTLTSVSNMTTGLRLTDMETCYKVFRREALKEISVTQNRFGFEPEVTAKIARLGCRVVERPISYHARRFDEGKKIGLKDAISALYCIARYAISD